MKPTQTSLDGYKAAENMGERVVRQRDLKPQPDGTHVTCLPGGYALLNATPTESMLVKIYAAECLRLKPPKVIVKCQQAIDSRQSQLETAIRETIVKNADWDAMESALKAAKACIEANRRHLESLGRHAVAGTSDTLDAIDNALKAKPLQST